MTEVILTLGQAFEIAYQMVLESDKYPKNMTQTVSNSNKNNVEENKANNAINFNNPQNNISHKNNSNVNDKETPNRKDDNNKENVKSTYITTINITTTDQNSYSKDNDKVSKTNTQSGNQ